MSIAPDVLFFDIETLPTLDVDLIADIEKEVSPPGSITKPESIEAWQATKGVEARREAVRKSSLDGGTGRLASLAWAWGGSTIYGGHTAMDGAWSEEKERKFLTGFFAELERFHAEFRVPPTLVGHNICGFDVRWLWKRSIVLGIRPPAWWPVDSRPWDHSKVQDTMLLWEGAKGRISQDRLARTLGLQGKGSIDGSMVADAWEEGRHEEIREYNVDDVRTVRRIWCRIVGEDAPEEEEEVGEETAAVGVEVPVEVVPEDPRQAFYDVPVEVAENTSDDEIIDAILGPLDKSIQEAPLRYLKAFEVPMGVVPEPEVEAVVERPAKGLI